MKIRSILFILILSSFVLSCSSIQQKPKTVQEKINELESIIFSEESKYTTDDATALANLYIRFADSIPTDSLSPEYLFKAADILRYQLDTQRTIAIFDRIMTAYPRHEKAIMSLFLKAFVFDTQLNDTASAHMYYADFIEKYPSNIFAEDAKNAINNLGKSLEEIIKEFEEQNKQ